MTLSYDEDAEPEPYLQNAVTGEEKRHDEELVVMWLHQRGRAPKLVEVRKSRR